MAANSPRVTFDTKWRVSARSQKLTGNFNASLAYRQSAVNRSKAFLCKGGRSGMKVIKRCFMTATETVTIT